MIFLYPKLHKVFKTSLECHLLFFKICLVSKQWLIKYFTRLYFQSPINISDSEEECFLHFFFSIIYFCLLNFTNLYHKVLNPKVSRKNSCDGFLLPTFLYPISIYLFSNCGFIFFVFVLKNSNN